MRYLILLIVLGCSSSNETETETIIGTWNAYRYVYEENGNITQDVTLNECASQTYYMFNNDYTYTYTSYGGTANDCSSSSHSGTYTLTGDILSMSGLEYDRTIQLTDGTLILKSIACNFDCNKYNIYYFK